MKTFLIAAIFLNTIVMGYGHQLAQDDFLKWICVFVWALVSFAAIGIYESEN